MPSLTSEWWWIEMNEGAFPLFLCPPQTKAWTQDRYPAAKVSPLTGYKEATYS